jgi:hypothetical protein
MARRRDPRHPRVMTVMRRRDRDRVLELDGAAGRDHRGREQRRDVRGSRAHRADADDRRSGSGPGSSAGCERATGGAASGSAETEHVGEHA